MWDCLRSCSIYPLLGVFNSYEVTSASVLLLDLHSLPAYGGLADVVLLGVVSGDRVVVPYSRHCRVFLMHKKHDVKSALFGRDSFAVTVYPHVDYAFITSVVVVLHEINMDRSGED
ncbi:hypothetical protein ACLB2K_065227 [Fragaria x ananassa]